MQVINPGDSDAVIVEKAAKVLPRPNQTAWMRLERTFFLHFGMNTFRGVEWGDGHEDPSIFNPTSLDANQWVGAMKNAGGNMVILVSKHHDGFCLWPTRYTPHSVASSPWLDGKGDEVGAVAEAAKAHSMKLGIYLSPADLYQLRTNPQNPAGYYGNGSPRKVSVIPTDPASFQTDPSKGRSPAKGFGSYTYEVDDYNRYFLNQLYELLTQYGPISVVWFDGANPDPSVKETYDYTAWYDLIRKLQPQAAISVKAPDSRWVGNEGGVGRLMEWSVIPLPVAPADCTWPDLYGDDLGSREKLKPGSYLWWYPAEVNTSILYGWFWAPGKRVKTASDMIDFYYNSVGRNGNMLLNLPPDTRGLIPDDQLEALNCMAQVINDTFAMNLASGGKLSADSSNPANSPDMALDGDLDTWWEAAPGQLCATFTLTLPAAVTFDVVSLQEAVDHRSQRIESFAIDTWDGKTWKVVDTQTTVGHKRLLRLASPVTTDQVRIRILGSRLEPTLAEVGLFKQAIAVPPPVISERDANGLVTIGCPEGKTIVFTTDGSLPGVRSAVYRSPISMPQGGTVQAAFVTAQGRLGMIASKYYAGMVPSGWTVVNKEPGESEKADNAAINAIDGNPHTVWQTRSNAGHEQPYQFTVDMGRANKIRGFTYLPRQDGSPDGVVELFRFETSMDCVNWTTNLDNGRFGNIKNNSVLQEVTFTPVTARFFRFTALKEINSSDQISISEISVLPVIAQ
jgi:alpha-L-fucosidase